MKAYKCAMIALPFVVGAALCLTPNMTSKRPPFVLADEIKPEQPKDGEVYVWALPSQGHQSIIVLNVIDGNTVDAAYLVPVRVRLKGVTAPKIEEKGGKEARAIVDKLLAGQLRTAQLWGAGREGMIADFWMASEKEGEKGSWLSAVLIKEGFTKSK